MRILTILVGVLLAVLGVFSVANAGLSFISLAFPIGLALTLVGIVECFAYRKAIDDEEDKHWILIEGLTTFVLGIVVLSGQLAADIAVPVVFGMWSLISGIRGLVIILAMSGTREEKDIDYYWDLVASVLSLVLGVYAFYNTRLFHWSVLMILGLIFVVQGANVIKISFAIPYKKPDLIKSKDEKIADAEKEAKKAHKEMKIAIKKARKARHAVREVAEEKAIHEIIAEPVATEPITIAVEEVVEEPAEEPKEH